MARETFEIPEMLYEKDDGMLLQEIAVNIYVLAARNSEDRAILEKALHEVVTDIIVDTHCGGNSSKRKN